MQQKSKAKKSNGSTPPSTRERRHVYEHVLNHMRRGLMIGAFLPGQVMSLRKLAAAFGTSPMPVREVLSRLVAANALEETSNGSARVPRLGPDRLADLFAVREIVEGNAAELAGKKANPNLANKLATTNKQLLEAIEKRDILGCLSLNQKFHFSVYHASGSEVLMPLIESLWLQFGPTMYMSLLIPSMPWNASFHENVLEAFRAGNAAGVKKGIVQDIRTTRKALLSLPGSPAMNELPFVARSELFMDF